MKQACGLYPGDRVQVRSFNEISATLNDQGCLENLPFMPEMLGLCGLSFAVRHRLEKTCAEGPGRRLTPHALALEGRATMRLLPHTVTLESAYCDGSAHDGCQRSCPLLWKEAWLKPLEAAKSDSEIAATERAALRTSLPTKKDALHYFCQSTELARATSYLFPISWRRCTAEYQARNVNLSTALRFLWLPFLVKVKTKLLGLSRVQPVGKATRTPVQELMLRPGELVEVKNPQEIALTLDQQGRNRGLAFTPTMLPFCGRDYQVRSRVERGILESNGEMHNFQATVILEGVTCDGHTFLGGCSRNSYHLWREIWLRRVMANGSREE